MEANHVYIVHYQGRDVECYGTLEEDSNFSVVCDDESDDSVWCDGDPAGGSFTTWEDVVKTLQPQFNSDILEIGSC
jgi:hypothetical protein